MQGPASFGADNLAAATAFCAKPSIYLPEYVNTGELPGRTIIPRDILVQWEDRKIVALLDRSLFDPATYGRVKFHDQDVRDYLSACWLLNCRIAGQPLRKVRRFVFGEELGELSPILSRRNILGWLATISEEIRQDAIKAAPDVVLYCGDAAQIPIEDRAKALRSLANRLKEIVRSDWHVYDSDVRRVADPALEPVVRELLNAESDNYELTSFLLRVARLTPMPGVADIATALATNPAKGDSLMSAAARTVVDIGTDEQKMTVLEFAQTASNLSNQLLGSFCLALFPKVIDVDGCMQIPAHFDGPEPRQQKAANPLG